MDNEWFVLTSKRTIPTDNLDKMFRLNLLILFTASFVNYFLISYDTGRIPQDWFVDYYPFGVSIIRSILFTFLEIVFFILLPYVFRFILKPKVMGEIIIDDKYQNEINLNLKKDIALLMQIRSAFLILISIYTLIYNYFYQYLFNEFQYPSLSLNFANFLTAFAIIIYLYPRYFEKNDVEEKYIMSKRQNVNQPYYYKKSKAEVVLSGTFYLGFIYLISWIIVFGALRLILLEPWGLNG